MEDPRALRLTSGRWPVKVVRSSPVGLRVRRTWRFKEIDPLPHREGTSRNGWQPTADAPAYHGTSQATAGNRAQRVWLNLAVFGAARFAADCNQLQPRGSMTA